MTLPAVVNPYVPILGLNSAGNTGYAYIGIEGENPLTDPQDVFWDAAGLVPASQPLAVIAGYFSNAGAPAVPYTAAPYSMTVLNSSDVQIFTNPSVASEVSGDKLDSDLSNVDATGVQKSAFRATVYDDYSTMIAPGAVGDNATDDTAAIQAALDTGRNIVLPHGSTFKITAPLIMQSNFQRFGGMGVLDFRGNCGVVVTNGCVGAELDLAVNAPTHTGTAISVIGADRVRIKRLYGTSVYSAIYIKKCNMARVDYGWVEASKSGITWWGDASNRSDVLSVGTFVVDVHAGDYGLDINGNCDSFDCQAMQVVNGKGGIVRNTTGGADPVIGRFNYFASDFSSADGLRIIAGQDFDVAMAYLQGAAGSGLYVGAAVDARRVRVSGGKIQGNARYGIESAGPVVAYSANADLQDNTLGKTSGPIWTESPRFAVDDNFYRTLSSGNPLINFDTNDNMIFGRASNRLAFNINSQEEWTIEAGRVSSRANALPATTLGFANGAAAATATLTNAPAAGNPTKWIPVDDNGTTRHIPAW